MEKKLAMTSEKCLPMYHLTCHKNVILILFYIIFIKLFIVFVVFLAFPHVFDMYLILLFTKKHEFTSNRSGGAQAMIEKMEIFMSQLEGFQTLAGGTRMYMWLYVDDILIVGKSHYAIDETKEMYISKAVKELICLHGFLGDLGIEQKMRSFMREPSILIEIVPKITPHKQPKASLFDHGDVHYILKHVDAASVSYYMLIIYLDKQRAKCPNAMPLENLMCYLIQIQMTTIKLYSGIEVVVNLILILLMDETAEGNGKVIMLNLVGNKIIPIFTDHILTSM
ncbi:hypothetical protein ACJX0J_014614, partial [Zea mays]